MEVKNPAKYIENIGRMVTKTIFRYDLIQEDDKILVAVSGGKDSLVLLETLAMRRKHMPIHYSLEAVHVDVTNIHYQIDFDYIQSFCDNHDIPFHIKEIEINFESDKRKSPCFVCSWYRRRELFRLTRQMGCNKLAMGHHRDDAIETLLMNMIHHGSISSLPPSLSMFEGSFDIIRPLIVLSDEQLNTYAGIRAFAKEKKLCPYGDQTSRNETKKLFDELEKMNPNARKNIFRAMSYDKVFHDYLPDINTFEKENY